MLTVSPPVNKATDLTSNGYLKAYPNATSNQEYFSFKLPCNNVEGFLVVADMTGRTVYNSVINGTANFMAVNTGTWNNGTYLYRLTCNDTVVGSGKFVVIK